MTSSRRIGLLAAVLFLGASMCGWMLLGALRRDAGPAAPTGHPPRELGGADGRAADGAPQLDATDTAIGGDPASVDERHLEAGPALHGTVELSAASNGASARAVWAWARVSDDSGLAGVLATWDELLARSRAVEVSGDRYTLTEGPPAELRSGSWVFVLGRERSPAATRVSESSTVRPLAPHAMRPLPVRVVDRSGALPQGCRVRSVGWCTDAYGSAATDRLLVFDEVPVGNDGRAECTRLSSESILVAVAEDGAAAPWTGDMLTADEVVLELRTSARAVGFVRGAAGVDLASCRVLLYHAADSTRALIGGCDVLEEGDLRPTRIPSFDRGDYVARLEGAGVVPAEQRVPATADAEEIRFDLVAEPGCAFRVIVASLDESAIAGATIVVSWDRDGDGPGEPGRLTSHTDADGVATVASSPPGAVWIDATAPGYAATRAGPFLVPDSLGGGDALTLHLARAGTIEVVCTHDGEPVTDYTVRYWQGQPWNLRERQVRASESGRCSIEDAPLGDVDVYVCTPELAHSEVRTVEVKPGAPSELQFELASPILVTGRIVDGVSGLPLRDAVVEVFPDVGPLRAGSTSGPLPVSASGELQGVLLSAHPALVEFRAPGYASDTRRNRPAPSGVLDLGDVRLFAGHTLTVRLTGSEDTDWTTYRIDLSEAREHAPVACDEDGEVRFDGVKAGDAIVSVYSPGGSRQSLYVLLEPNGEWTREIPVETDRRLVIEVDSEDPVLLQQCSVGVSFAPSSGFFDMWYSGLADDGTIDFAGITGDEAIVEVVGAGPTFERLGFERVAISPGENHVRIALEEGSRFLRFVDPLGNAVARASVDLAVGGDRPLWFTNLTTSEDGSIEAHCLGDHELTADVVTENGVVTGLPIPRATHPGEVTTVVIDLSASLRLRLLDGNEPLEGVDVHLSAAPGHSAPLRYRSDAHGRIEVLHVNPRPYAVLAVADHTWRTELELTATADPPEAIVQVRRLGGVDIALTRAGAPVPSARIELVSAEFGELASQWLSQSRIRSSTESLAFDPSGRLQLTGLPHGAYSWTVDLPDGTRADGDLIVPPLGVVPLPISLP